MTGSELYKELGILTKDRDRWKESIPYVSSLLTHESAKIQAKALWLLGEMGLVYPQSVRDAVPLIASFLDSPEPLLRERAVNALGRIGRADYSLIERYWKELFRFAADQLPERGDNFICFGLLRRILTGHKADGSGRTGVGARSAANANTPDVYEDHMSVFAGLLHDADDRVRMEAPEIFRVLGKRRPDFVRPYVEQLRQIAETDENRVVSIHCLGAIRAAGSK